MQKFYRLSVNIVKILTLLLAVFLFIGSFLTTCYAENMETHYTRSDESYLTPLSYHRTRKKSSTYTDYLRHNGLPVHK